MTIQNNIIEEVFPKTLEILSKLIKFQTVSGTSNVELIDYCEKKLNSLGAKSFKTYDEEKLRVNLFSTISGKKKLNGGRLNELKAPNKNNSNEFNTKVFFNLIYTLLN